MDSVVKINGDTFVKGAFPSHLDTYYDHYLECYNHCEQLESALTGLEETFKSSFFPAILGRRPNTALNNTPSFQGKENVSHITNGSSLVSSKEGCF